MEILGFIRALNIDTTSFTLFLIFYKTIFSWSTSLVSTILVHNIGRTRDTARVRGFV